GWRRVYLSRVRRRSVLRGTIQQWGEPFLARRLDLDARRPAAGADPFMRDRAGCGAADLSERSLPCGGRCHAAGLTQPVGRRPAQVSFPSFSFAQARSPGDVTWWGFVVIE